MAAQRMMMKKTQGTIQVYTGNGKGKTTAALGQALRAIGHGQRTLLIQFMKRRRTGEQAAARRLPGFTIVQSGSGRFVRKGKPDPADVRLAQAGLTKAKQAMTGGRYDLVILDEVNVAMDFGFLRAMDVLDLLKNKPREVEVILTGRSAPAAIRRAADLVSEIREVKHPYRRGIPARPGVEF
ncbi:MAG: cob(I)yrinic acid a,c-diamide adenosyltransferase [Verrucomicrobiota bacterium]|nr:cob(I)yrinic acid a,c-diamide adenosyltransferase [Verrucomicrobiota bacterium]